MRRNWIKMFLRVPKRKCLGIVSYLIILAIAKGCSADLVVNRDGPSSFSCPEGLGCACTSRSLDFEVECPATDQRIRVRIKPHEYVDVECSSMHESNYLYLPRITNITEKILRFKNCPLPRRRPIQAVLERIGVHGLRKLYFYGAQGESDVALSRQHFKGLETLEDLDLKKNGFSEIPEDTFADLRNLKRLDLRENNIERLENIFNGLEKLEFIELGNNKIEQIPEGMFSTQKNLYLLNLWQNRLYNLSTNAFAGAISLSDLDISSNNMEYLQNDVFHQLRNLTNINLTKNSFKSMPIGLLDNNPGLKIFRMLDNQVTLETLPDAFLANKPNLERVLIKCDLKTVPENLLSNSTSISEISLAGNKLESLPPNLFIDQAELKELDLSHNQIAHLDDSLFAHTDQLERLVLSYNQLQNISRDVFGRLKNLKELYLQNNRLENFDSDALISVTALTKIYLQNNKLSFKERAFDTFDIIISPFRNLLQLRQLNLRNNTISHNFLAEILTLQVLQKLDLSYNNITYLHHSDLQFTSNTIDVNLTNNFIESIDFAFVEFFETDYVRDVKVYLDKNPVICDCRLLDFVKYVKSQEQKGHKMAFQVLTGDLKCSPLGPLAGTPVDDVNTMELLCPLDPPNRVDKQCPENCSCWLRPVERTLIVNCSNLNLVKVPKLPKAPVDWHTELHIENNEIRSLPTLDTYGYGYGKVSKIYATNNNLSCLTPGNIPPRLSVIDLSNNKFSVLNVDVLRKLQNVTTLTSISLGGTNPWLCNCDLLENLDFIQKNFKKISDLNATRCTTGKQISTLAPSDICPENVALIAASAFCAILSLIFGLLFALYYKYQQEIKVWLYAHNWCLWFVTEEELDKDKLYDAFISYSHKDEDFVAEHLVPQLEKGPIKYTLCLHARDWMAGEFIPNQITRSVEDSRRTIVVLSPNFVKSIWGRMEFRAAHTAALKEGRTRVIVVVYEDVGDVDKLDSELKAYLTMNTYVKWKDPWFWEKLRYALPHPPKKSRMAQALAPYSALKIGEKMELTTTTDSVQSTTPPIEQAIRHPLVSNSDGKPYQNGISKDQYQININDLNKQLDGVYI